MAYGNYEDFCHNKLLLDPREATFFDLIRLLFSSDIKSRKFIDCSEEQVRRSFCYRWIIFISVLVQKILLYFKNPMARIGDTLEMWLNLLSGNGGFFGLLRNYIKGEIVRPERTSATFTSVIGNLDLRVDLERKIRPGHRKYNPFLSLMAAKLSYENEAFIKSVVTNHWNMEFLEFYNFWNDLQEEPSTQAFLFQDKKNDPNMVVVAFRGTSPFDAYDWCTDVDLSWYEIPGAGKVHRGFMKALGQQKNGWPIDIKQDKNHLYAYYAIRKKLKQIVDSNKNVKIMVAGHSLGGALAILFMAVLALHDESLLLEKLEGVYTFGQPRVGDAQFGQFVERKLETYKVKYLRFVYCNDMVPRLPFDDKNFLYKHFGGCHYYNSCYKEKILKEEPNKNYFSLLWVLPKIFNAVWELLRSFVIPYTKGKEYKEGWFMKMFRIIALVIPGLPAHIPQDYDNSTRLGL